MRARLWQNLVQSSSAETRRFFSTSVVQPFDKILIANRGEIACRVIRTAKRLGIRTVAIYSDADATAQHVLMSDEAYNIGPPPASESYLLGDKILEIAKQTGAQAIHPGYGFLSENAEFCEACAKEGVTFIGPPASAIFDMGSKSASKDIMIAADVPVTPGYHGDNQDPQFLLEEAKRIGFPLMIKAVLGGGGKGMRVVDNEDEFLDMLDSAKRESLKSFSDDVVLLEKFVRTSRHIEFQVFADTHGEAIHLFERDCSVQRRHQKVLEEAPAPFLEPHLRKEMGDAAVAAAKAVGYVGAGTVEFLFDADDKSFYFMEMNTRLQVEHPVTELVTGLDLVEWQLHVAAGGSLPLEQDEVNCNGHAIEARIYAENPYNNFLPAIGTVDRLRVPAASKNVRVDTGIVEGDEIKLYYDPMISKLLAWGKDRPTALATLCSAIQEYEVVGVANNLDFCRRVAQHPDFAIGGVATNFLEIHGDALTVAPSETSDSVIVLGALSLLLSQQQASGQLKSVGAAASPWVLPELSSARLFGDCNTVMTLLVDGEEVQIQVVSHRGGVFTLRIEDKDGNVGDPVTAKGSLSPDGELVAAIGNSSITCSAAVNIHSSSGGVVLFGVDEGRHTHSIQLVAAAGGGGAEVAGANSVVTPMPGTVVKTAVHVGDTVKKGDTLLILGAMKMEHTIVAPADATVKALNFAEGDMVADGSILVELE